MRGGILATAALLCAACATLQAGEKVTLQDLPKHAVERSQLTLPGSTPFHLKAKIFEKTDRDNDSHNAEVVEDWIAPDKWRRTITSHDFSETLIVNGAVTHEELRGDYFPNWLRTLVNGLFEPGAPLKDLDLTKSGDPARLELGPDGKFRAASDAGAEICRRFGIHVSTQSATNTVFATYCFHEGLLESIGIPGYDVSYADYRDFGEKRVARKLSEYIEPGTELEADVDELETLSNFDEANFTVESPTSSLQTLIVGNEMLQKLVRESPDIQWPPMNGGRNPGTLSIYICIDRQGHVRETYPLNSDSPDMAQAAREQVMKWTFQRAMNSSHQSVQVESILTFNYHAPEFPKK
jgi:hypothetical protein